jgi:hypothetical protein
VPIRTLPPWARDAVASSRPEPMLSRCGGTSPRRRRPPRGNDRGSTPSDLARWTTGRGGVGSEAAKAERQIIIDLLKRTTG